MDHPPTNYPAAAATRPAGSSGSPLLLVLAWLVVAVPAGWGVSQTVIKSMALFQGHATPAATAPAAVPPTQP